MRLGDIFVVMSKTQLACCNCVIYVLCCDEETNQMVGFSFSQTEVTTVVCDHKQLKKLMDLSKQLMTVQRVVLLNDFDGNLEVPMTENSSSSSSSKWTLTSFSKVERLGSESPAELNMPTANDVAIIMYTSGSTGMPKVVFFAPNFLGNNPSCGPLGVLKHDNTIWEGA
jgi:long-subunit acyl-CoA synthetase (AMP-forming)